MPVDEKTVFTTRRRSRPVKAFCLFKRASHARLMLKCLIQAKLEQLFIKILLHRQCLFIEQTVVGDLFSARDQISCQAQRLTALPTEGLV